ncbi:hypothetical protein [Bdellovibrio bacteriovorus]|uniref:Uncharacterized protein n=1 Tax=Bdellovibrio bacteriovorus TaxID=959 RepID=A0A1Z3N9Y6_BDEBC|nr:hypothetical protein [Bdellovibrio bacteriovorus]ASD64245.1 hypothetical protein B9G79_12040 [Bdellovibrio bacteriovorus]
MNSRESRREFKRQASKLLATAEQWYGGRDKTWNFAGVTFSSDGPYLYYPPGDEKMVEIHLMKGVKDDQALYQLSHEVVHLLAPARHPPAIMLEEGLAVKFSIEAPNYMGRDYRRLAIEDLKTNSNYCAAYNLVRELLILKPKAVMQLRSEEPNFFAMTPEFITKTLGVDLEFAVRLTERRQMR